MATTSRTALEDTLRARLLDFERSAGGTLADDVGARLYIDEAPDDVALTPGPYAVMRVINDREADDQAAGCRACELEVMLAARPRARLDALKAAGDGLVEAMCQYSDATGGLVFALGAASNALPRPPAPMDATLAQVRVLAALQYYPEFLLP